MALRGASSSLLSELEAESNADRLRGGATGFGGDRSRLLDDRFFLLSLVRFLSFLRLDFLSFLLPLLLRSFFRLDDLLRRLTNTCRQQSRR